MSESTSAPDDSMPCLRRGLQAFQDHTHPHILHLYDRFRIADSLMMSSRELQIVQLFNGRRTIRDIQSDFMHIERGVTIPEAEVRQLISKLDDRLFLDSPKLKAFFDEPIRKPSCIGCYPDNPIGIREGLDSLFTRSGGPGLPDPAGSHIDSTHPPIRAALLPHIDYNRGNVSYAWGFKELIERTNATTFVIIGTSHYSSKRFSLTRKHFRSPLGLVETDQKYLDRIVSHHGDGLFDDPLAHIPEHSIELEVVFLQYLLEKQYSFRIVPLLVGSFGDCVRQECSPGQKSDIRRMIEALQFAEAGAEEEICYLISGDLAHIGPKFDDPQPLSDWQLIHSKKQDDALIACAESVDAEGYYQLIADESDARRICGLPPTYLTLQVAKPSRGKLLHYGRYVHPTGNESVSFASMVFER